MSAAASVGQALGAAAADKRAGAPLAASLSAWRKVFEREQMAALARFRSVPAGTPHEHGAAGVAGDSAACAKPAPAGSNPGQPRPAGAASAGSPASGATRWAAPGTAASDAGGRLEREMATVAPAVSLAAARSPATASGSAKPLAGPEAASVAAATALVEWPCRKLHCMADADGVHVWLRDAGLAPDDAAVVDMRTRLRQVLAQSGARLASFTLNGIAIEAGA